MLGCKIRLSLEYLQVGYVLDEYKPGKYIFNSSTNINISSDTKCDKIKETD